VSTGKLLEKPYNQRRIILVTDRVPGPVTSNKPLSRRVIPTLLAIPFGLSGVLASAAIEAYIKARREMRQGGEDLIPISSAEAAQLRFPVGHPRGKVVYIGHPVDPPVYLPLADFHRFLFEHKVAEALRLIRSLGAVTIQVLRVEGWDQTAGIGLAAALPGVQQAGVGVSVADERVGGRSVLSTMRLNPTQSPSVPADLVWLPHEPLWQEVAQARIESGLDSFVIDVRSTEDYGVNASLKALVLKAGLDAGGSFVEHRHTVWRLQGTFS